MVRLGRDTFEGEDQHERERQDRSPEPDGLPTEGGHPEAAGAARLSALDGKTVYLVDCRFDDSDVFLKQVQAWFAQHMPGVRTVFKQISSVYLKDDPTTSRRSGRRGRTPRSSASATEAPSNT